MKILEIRTTAREDVVDITDKVLSAVESSGVKDGFGVVFVPHTTAGLMINENADPDVKDDILMALRRLVPDDLPFKHGEGNSPAHVKASLVGSSANVIIKEGRPALGTWQGIYFCEFDGPRRREIWVKLIPAFSQDR